PGDTWSPSPLISSLLVPARSGSMATMRPSATARSALLIPVAVTSVPLRTMRSYRLIDRPTSLFRQKVQKPLQHLDCYLHILHSRRLGGIVADTPSTSYKEHGNIGELAHRCGIVSCSTWKGKQWVPHFLNCLRQCLG